MIELNTRTCVECEKIFRTPNNDQLCPACKKKHKEESKKAVAEECKAVRFMEQEEKPKPKVSIVEEQRIERVYNAVHKSRYHGYGEIVKLIEDRKDNTCVCCGEIVPEGRMVCPNCERMADDARK